MERVYAGMIEYRLFSESLKRNCDYVNFTGFELIGCLIIVIS